MVPKRRLELPRGNPRQHLKLVRLPIPPFGHIPYVKYAHKTVKVFYKNPLFRESLDYQNYTRWLDLFSLFIGALQYGRLLSKKF
jgi:hypothetical protein